jgi:hypothetical protein
MPPVPLPGHAEEHENPRAVSIRVSPWYKVNFDWGMDCGFHLHCC